MWLPKRKINHSSSKQNDLFFYCCLFNITASAITKATFMIAIPTNPNNSSLIIINNAVSIIITTSIYQSHNQSCRIYVKHKRWQHTLLILTFLCNYIIHSVKSQVVSENLFHIFNNKNFQLLVGNFYCYSSSIGPNNSSNFASNSFCKFISS